MSAQVRMQDPVHATGYTQINPPYQEQVYRYEDSYSGMDNTSKPAISFLVKNFTSCVRFIFLYYKNIQTGTDWTRTV